LVCQVRYACIIIIANENRDPIAAVGCADVAPPHGAEASREGDVMVIRCNSTGETWFLSCSGSRWTGTVGNCSTHQSFTASKS